MSKLYPRTNLLEKKETRFGKKEKNISTRNSSNWINWSNLGCASSTRFQLGQESRKPRYRLPNSRVNLRRDDRRGEGHGCELLDIRNKGMPSNYSRTVSYAALVTKVT